MTNPIVLTEPQWNKLEKHLRKTLPFSAMAIRTKMRRVLGFTPREHEYWVDHKGSTKIWKERCTEIHLDFFDEYKKTMFCLKYSEFISKDYGTGG